MNFNFIKQLYLDNKFDEKLNGIEKLPVELLHKILEYVLPTRNKRIQKRLKKHIWKKSCAFLCANPDVFFQGSFFSKGSLIDYFNENNINIQLRCRYNEKTMQFVNEKVFFSVTEYLFPEQNFYKIQQKMD